jgi:hypothetical protein
MAKKKKRKSKKKHFWGLTREERLKRKQKEEKGIT